MHPNSHLWERCAVEVVSGLGWAGPCLSPSAPSTFTAAVGPRIACVVRHTGGCMVDVLGEWEWEWEGMKECPPKKGETGKEWCRETLPSQVAASNMMDIRHLCGMSR